MLNADVWVCYTAFISIFNRLNTNFQESSLSAHKSRVAVMLAIKQASKRDVEAFHSHEYSFVVPTNTSSFYDEIKVKVIRLLLLSSSNSPWRFLSVHLPEPEPCLPYTIFLPSAKIVSTLPKRNP